MGMVPGILPFRMNDQSLQRKIAELAQDSSKVILTAHAKRRMRERHILLTQILQVLQKGCVVEHAHQDIHGHWKCTLELLVSGDLIKVAAALGENELKEKVVVITVMH
jgi:Domain of unknown function (DUF4258)